MPGLPHFPASHLQPRCQVRAILSPSLQCFRGLTATPLFLSPTILTSLPWALLLPVTHDLSPYQIQITHCPLTSLHLSKLCTPSGLDQEIPGLHPSAPIAYLEKTVFFRFQLHSPPGMFLQRLHISNLTDSKLHCKHKLGDPKIQSVSV